MLYLLLFTLHSKRVPIQYFTKREDFMGFYAIPFACTMCLACKNIFDLLLSFVNIFYYQK